MYPHRAQRGFTLIEVLVTLVLISVGLLGIAALQLTTMRGNQESYVRSQANVLASDILDRIRANPFEFRDNFYNAAFNERGDSRRAAGQDLDQWQRSIDQLLPGSDADAAGSVQRIAGPAGREVVEITIQWSERPEGNGTPNDRDNGLRTFQLRSEI